MNRKQKVRYLLAIYGIILAVAIIIAVVVLFTQSEAAERITEWRGFWLNISTELIGAVAVFIIVNILFLLDDWDLGERVTQLLNRLERERPTAEKFFHKLPDLEPHIHDAQQIDMAGYTLTSAINKHLSSLRERLAQGARVRILIVDPALKLTRDALIAANPYLDITYSQKRVEATFQDLNYLFEKQQNLIQAGAKGSLEVRLLPQPLGTGIYGFNVDLDNGKYFIEMYPPVASGGTPSFTLVQNTDEQWFNYYKFQFEEIWKTAKPWEPNDDVAYIDGKNASSIPADEFLLRSFPAGREIESQVKEICLYGNTLNNTIKTNLRALTKILVTGGKLKIILTNQIVAERKHSKPLYQNTMETLSWLQKNPENKGSIEVREFSKPLLFSIHAYDPELVSGRIVVVMQTPLPTYETRPKFELLKFRDEHWFSYFYAQFNQIWEQSTPILLNQSSGKPHE